MIIMLYKFNFHILLLHKIVFSSNDILLHYLTNLASHLILNLLYKVSKNKIKYLCKKA